MPPSIACMRRSLTVQPYCLKGWVVCGTIYGDMHLKGLLRSIARVGYCIPVPDFLSRVTWLSLPKKHYNGLINKSICSRDLNSCYCLEFYDDFV